ncbi:MAG TPA: 5'-3' exonuclease H3TH domain-containing protein [Acidimicrobiales bacterium]
MQVHLVDGTYELFRHYYGGNPHTTAVGEEVSAVRGVVGSVIQMVEEGATHVGIATDHIIESFRNDMWPGYKTGDGVEPQLFAQFPLLEEALDVAGFTVWAMVEQEADDALGAASVRAAADPNVERVIICTPDKDMAQLVGGKVIQIDRRQAKTFDVDGVVEKFGVLPESIPDWLALVGDSADGFPGLKGWGAKSSATLLARYGHLDSIPTDPDQWDVAVRSAGALAATLAEGIDDALLFRDLATLRTDHPVFESVDELEWLGPPDRAAWSSMVGRLEAPALAQRVTALTG